MIDKQTALGNWDRHVAPSKPFTPAQMEARIARWGRIPSSERAFADTWVPGHERVLYNVIGSGVHDDPNFKPAVAAAENFHVDYIVAPPGCGAALHCHDTEEVFVAITGTWAVHWGDEGEHQVVLAERDVISVPPLVMRSFRNLDDRTPRCSRSAASSRPRMGAKLAEAAKARGVGFDGAGNSSSSTEDRLAGRRSASSASARWEWALRARSCARALRLMPATSAERRSTPSLPRAAPRARVRQSSGRNARRRDLRREHRSD